MVRRGVDTSKLTVSSAKGTVTVTGILAARSKRYEISKSGDMKQLDMSIRRIPNVKNVIWMLANWDRQGGVWKTKLVSKDQAG